MRYSVILLALIWASCMETQDASAPSPQSDRQAVPASQIDGPNFTLHVQSLGNGGSVTSVLSEGPDGVKLHTILREMPNVTSALIVRQGELVLVRKYRDGRVTTRTLGRPQPVKGSCNAKWAEPTSFQGALSNRNCTADGDVSIMQEVWDDGGGGDAGIGGEKCCQKEADAQWEALFKYMFAISAMTAACHYLNPLRWYACEGAAAAAGFAANTYYWAATAWQDCFNRAKLNYQCVMVKGIAMKPRELQLLVR